jgi:hypothetical protein
VGYATQQNDDGKDRQQADYHNIFVVLEQHKIHEGPNPLGPLNCGGLLCILSIMIGEFGEVVKLFVLIVASNGCGQLNRLTELF